MEYNELFDIRRSYKDVINYIVLILFLISLFYVSVYFCPMIKRSISYGLSESEIQYLSLFDIATFNHVEGFRLTYLFIEFVGVFVFSLLYFVSRYKFKKQYLATLFLTLSIAVFLIVIYTFIKLDPAVYNYTLLSN